MPTILYILSGILWSIEMFPQIYKTYHRKTVEDISIWFPVICVISFLCIFIAHIMLKRWILFVSQIPPFICNMIFFAQILIYRKNNES